MWSKAIISGTPASNYNLATYDAHDLWFSKDHYCNRPKDLLRHVDILWHRPAMVSAEEHATSTSRAHHSRQRQQSQGLHCKASRVPAKHCKILML